MIDTMSDEFNINDNVWVRLTAHGEALANGRGSEVDGGWQRWQLWCLMAEFGQHLWNGGETVFEKNEIRFTDPTAI